MRDVTFKSCDIFENGKFKVSDDVNDTTNITLFKQYMLLRRDVLGDKHSPDKPNKHDLYPDTTFLFRVNHGNLVVSGLRIIISPANSLRTLRFEDETEYKIKDVYNKDTEGLTTAEISSVSVNRTLQGMRLGTAIQAKAFAICANMPNPPSLIFVRGRENNAVPIINASIASGFKGVARTDCITQKYMKDGKTPSHQVYTMVFTNRPDIELYSAEDLQNGNAKPVAELAKALEAEKKAKIMGQLKKGHSVTSDTRRARL